MHRSLRILTALVAVVAVSPVVSPEGAPARADAPAPPPGTISDRRAEPEDRYALAGGCYAVRAEHDGRYLARSGAGFAAVAATIGDAEPFHFQATDLGQYLLYGTARDFVAGADDGLVAATAPSPEADWEVDQVADGSFVMRLPATGRTLVADAGRVGFELTDGCAAYPEVALNVTGPHAAGASPFEETTGYIDGHNHLMAFEFVGGAAHCGRPWHRYGAPFALVDCPDHVPADGLGAVLENILTNEPLGTHDPVGWPTFRDWPAPGSLTHEQTYVRWLERAWRGGLRVLVNLYVENRVLCEVFPLGDNPCDEMQSVRLQAQRLREFERYIDAQSGGPGEGWFRIVGDPFEARRVVNEGRLAVVPGIEVSELFGCSVLVGVPQCTTADIDRLLDEMLGLGVRQLLVVNKFDNALAGVTGDGGQTGIIVNSGNFYGTGRFWHMVTCDEANTGEHDNNQLLTTEPAQQDALFGALLAVAAPVAPLPLYPAPNHCNVHGLSPLGAHAIDQFVARHVIVDPDHMSVRARQQALDLLELHGYSGVFSSHSWASDDTYRRVYRLGGMTTPYAGGSTNFVREWRARREMADGRYLWGIGWGADSNGFGSQGGARGAEAEDPVTYPFEGLGGVVVDRQVSGERVYDINVDGVAHYGLYPDWVEDVRRQAGDEIAEDLAHGAEAYLQMWERAVGVPAPGCIPETTVDALTPGLTPQDVLLAAGQPTRRQGDTFTYCVTAFDGHAGARDVAFGADGRMRAAGGAATSGPQGSLPATGGAVPAAVAALVAVALLARAGRRRVTPPC